MCCIFLWGLCLSERERGEGYVYVICIVYVYVVVPELFDDIDISIFNSR